MLKSPSGIGLSKSWVSLTPAGNLVQGPDFRYVKTYEQFHKKWSILVILCLPMILPNILQIIKLKHNIAKRFFPQTSNCKWLARIILL